MNGYNGSLFGAGKISLVSDPVKMRALPDFELLGLIFARHRIWDSIFTALL